MRPRKLFSVGAARLRNAIGGERARACEDGDRAEVEIVRVCVPAIDARVEEDLRQDLKPN